ncbi:hypothetical protein pb186bvf_002845 [Paramecium bursaria]
MGCSIKAQKSMPKKESSQIKMTLSDVQLNDSNLSINIKINNCEVDNGMVFKKNELYPEIEIQNESQPQINYEQCSFRSQQIITKNQQCRNYLSARQINSKYLLDGFNHQQSQSPLKSILKQKQNSCSSVNLSQKTVVFGGQSIQYIDKQPNKRKKYNKITMDLLDSQF